MPGLKKNDGLQLLSDHNQLWSRNVFSAASLPFDFYYLFQWITFSSYTPEKKWDRNTAGIHQSNCGSFDRKDLMKLTKSNLCWTLLVWNFVREGNGKKKKKTGHHLFRLSSRPLSFKFSLFQKKVYRELCCIMCTDDVPSFSWSMQKP